MTHTIFDDMEDLFDSRRFSSDMALMNVITESTEEIITNTYITEATFKSIKIKIKEFFASITIAFKKFCDEIRIGVADKVRSLQIKEQLKKFKEELRENKEAGAKKVEIVDVVALGNTYLKMNTKLWKYVENYASMKYKKVYQIEKDIEEFDKIVDNYQTEIQKILDNKIKLDINYVSKFVEAEICGEGQVLKTLNENITEFHRLESECDKIALRKDVLGDDIIVKHIGFIRRAINKVTSFIKRIVVKIITCTVFIFA